MVLVGSETSEEAAPADFYSVGTACRVHRVHRQDGHLQVLVECLQRFRIDGWVSRRGPLQRPGHLPARSPPARRTSRSRAYAMAVINTIKELLPLNPLYVEELRMFLDRFGPEDPSHLADFAASLTTSTKEQLQEVLEAVPLLPRMEKVLVLLNNELELAKAQQKIRRSRRGADAEAAARVLPARSSSRRSRRSWGWPRTTAPRSSTSSRSAWPSSR